MLLFQKVNVINEVYFSVAVESNNEFIVIESSFYTQICLKKPDSYKNLSNKTELKTEFIKCHHTWAILYIH